MSIILIFIQRYDFIIVFVIFIFTFMKLILLFYEN